MRHHLENLLFEIDDRVVHRDTGTSHRPYKSKSCPWRSLSSQGRLLPGIDIKAPIVDSIGAFTFLKIEFSHLIIARQPSGDHGPGVGNRLPRHHHTSGQEGWLFEKEGPYWRGNADSAVWTVRRFCALRVPAALNLNPNAARSTFKCCSWMGFISTASMEQLDFVGSVHRPPRS